MSSYTREQIERANQRATPAPTPNGGGASSRGDDRGQSSFGESLSTMFGAGGASGRSTGGSGRNGKTPSSFKMPEPTKNEPVANYDHFWLMEARVEKPVKVPPTVETGMLPDMIFKVVPRVQHGLSARTEVGPEAGVQPQPRSVKDFASLRYMLVREVSGRTRGRASESALRHHAPLPRTARARARGESTAVWRVLASQPGGAARGGASARAKRARRGASCRRQRVRFVVRAGDGGTPRRASRTEGAAPWSTQPPPPPVCCAEVAGDATSGARASDASIVARDGDRADGPISSRPSVTAHASHRRRSRSRHDRDAAARAAAARPSTARRRGGPFRRRRPRARRCRA